MTVSAPHLVAQRIFSTSSSMLDATALLPILALIFTRKFRPMIMGSSSGWLMFAGMMARPLATSSRTNSGVIRFGVFAPKFIPGCWWRRLLRGLRGDSSDFNSSSPWFSRMAMNSISGVMMPWRAYHSCVTGCPLAARSGLDAVDCGRAKLPLSPAAERVFCWSPLFCGTAYSSTSPRAQIHSWRRRGKPCSTLPVNPGSPQGPEQSYTLTGSFCSTRPLEDFVGESVISRIGTRTCE
jgi:hypothetical protein